MLATISNMPKGFRGFQKGNKFRGMQGKKHTPEANQKNSDAHKGKPAWNKGKPSPWTSKRNKETNHLKRGENAHHWKGGTYGTERHRDMGRQEYKQWRSDVFQRDNWTCQTCKTRGIYLEAHHIKSWAKFPELRYEVSNGITLCLPCHHLLR